MSTYSSFGCGLRGRKGHVTPELQGGSPPHLRLNWFSVFSSNSRVHDLDYGPIGICSYDCWGVIRSEQPQPNDEFHCLNAVTLMILSGSIYH